MGNEDATMNGLVTFILCMVLVWSLWYFAIFNNFMVVALEVWGWDFFPVEQEFWWLAVGLILLSSFGAAMKVFEYSRRGKRVDH